MFISRGLEFFPQLSPGSGEGSMSPEKCLKSNKKGKTRGFYFLALPHSADRLVLYSRISVRERSRFGSGTTPLLHQRELTAEESRDLSQRNEQSYDWQMF